MTCWTDLEPLQMDRSALEELRSLAESLTTVSTRACGSPVQMDREGLSAGSIPCPRGRVAVADFGSFPLQSPDSCLASHKYYSECERCSEALELAVVRAALPGPARDPLPASSGSRVRLVPTPF